MGMEARNGDETAPTMESEFISAKFGPWMIVSRKGRFKGNKERDSPKASSRNSFGKGDEGSRFGILANFSTNENHDEPNIEDSKYSYWAIFDRCTSYLQRK